MKITFVTILASMTLLASSNVFAESSCASTAQNTTYTLEKATWDQMDLTVKTATETIRLTGLNCTEQDWTIKNDKPLITKNTVCSLGKYTRATIYKEKSQASLNISTATATEPAGFKFETVAILDDKGNVTENQILIDIKGTATDYSSNEKTDYLQNIVFSSADTTVTCQ